MYPLPSLGVLPSSLSSLKSAVASCHGEPVVFHKEIHEWSTGVQ